MDPNTWFPLILFLLLVYFLPLARRLSLLLPFFWQSLSLRGGATPANTGQQHWTTLGETGLPLLLLLFEVVGQWAGVICCRHTGLPVGHNALGKLPLAIACQAASYISLVF